jgi:hypothetical protein
MRFLLGLFLAISLFSCKKEDMPDPPMSGYLWPQTQCAGKFLDLRRTHPNEDPRQQLTVSYFIRYQGEPNYVKYAWLPTVKDGFEYVDVIVVVDSYGPLGAKQDWTNSVRCKIIRC